MTFSDEAKAALAAPLDRRYVKPPAPGKYGDYVEGWHVIAEANRIFGFDGWTRETVSMIETNRELMEVKDRYGKEVKQWRVGYLVKVRVTAGDVTREGTGFGSGMSKPEALGDAIESAAKEGETDAMKRAMMTFGNPFGLALYDKTKSNVADNVQETLTEARTEVSEAVGDSTSRLVFPAFQSDLRAQATDTTLTNAWQRWLPVIINWSDDMQQNCHDVLDEMRRYLAEHDGDGRKASRDVIEAELRAAVSMEDLNGKRNKFREAFMKLGKDDQLYLSAVTKEMEAAIKKMGGKMPAFDTLSREAAEPKLTPEQEHAAKVASTP